MNKAIQETALWKAPGSDGLPTGYLKMCGKPLTTVLERLYNTTLRLGHWPSPFRRARVVVLPRPGKTQEQLRFTSVWRPAHSAAELSGKALGENNGSPESDPGRSGPGRHSTFVNRQQRSTEAAVKLVVHSISPYGLESQG